MKPVAGKKPIVNALSTVRGPAQISKNIEYAFLDDNLFSIIQQDSECSILQQAIIDKWFPHDGEVIKTVAVEERQIVTYEQVLRGGVEHRAAEQKDDNYNEKTRDAAFSRVVREAYDFRCAASGWRVVLPDGSVMVEAAHLIPFFKSHDDDPRNGIALSPTFHWALDKQIFAPGPDLKWHVSPLLDKRNRDHQELIDLDKEPILLPTNKKYYPRLDALKWCMEQLVK